MSICQRYNLLLQKGCKALEIYTGAGYRKGDVIAGRVSLLGLKSEDMDTSFDVTQTDAVGVAVDVDMEDQIPHFWQFEFSKDKEFSRATRVQMGSDGI